MGKRMLRWGSLARASARWGRNALLAVLALVLLVLGGVHVALLTDAGRDYARAKLVPLLSDALDAQLSLGSIDALSLFGVRMRSVQLRSRRGELLASLAKLDVGLEPLSLLSGKVHVTHLALDDAFVELGAPLDEGGGLPGLFSKPDAKKEDETKSSSGPNIALDGIALRGGHVQATVRGARWEARGLTLQGDVALGAALGLRVARLGGELVRAGTSIGALEGGAGNYAASEQSDVRLALRVGRSTLRVNARLGAPDGDGVQSVQAALGAHAIEPETLAALGVEGEILRAPVDLQLNGKGTTRSLSATLALISEHGTLNIDGSWQAPLTASATIETSGFVPARVFATELEPVAGTVQLQADRAEGAHVTALELSVVDARYGVLPLPRTTSRGQFTEGQGLQVERLEARAPGVVVNAHGSVGIDGALALSARVDAPALAQEPALGKLVPGLAGALTADVSLERRAAGALDAKLDARLARGGLGNASVQTLRVTGRVRGPASDRVQANLQLNAGGVHAGKLVLNDTQLALRGGPDRFTLEGRGGGQGFIRALAQHDQQRWTIDGALDLPLETARVALALPARVPPRVPPTKNEHPAVDAQSSASMPFPPAPSIPVISMLHARVQRLQLESAGGMSVRKIELAYQDARITLAGTIDARDRANLSASIVVPRLQAPTALALDPPLHGSLQLQATARGALRAPRVEVDAKYRCEHLEGLHDVALDLGIDADLRDRRVQAKAQLHADGVAAKLAVESRLSALTADALRSARSKVALDIDRLPLHALARWPQAPAVPKTLVLAGTFHAEGTLEDYLFDTALRASAQFAHDDAPIEAWLDAKFDQKELVLELRAADRQGPLIRTAIQTELQGPSVALDRASFERLIAERGWDVSLWLGARRIDALPATRALGVPEALWPARVSLDAKLQHRAGVEPTGQLQARAAWDPPAAETAAPLCGARAPYVALEGSMGSGKLHAEVKAGSGGRDALALALSSSSPINEWLRVDPGRVRPVEAKVRFLDLELGDLPVVCESVRGRLAGTAELSRGLTRAVTVSAKLQGKMLTFMESPPIGVTLDAHARGDQVIGTGVISAKGGRAELFAQIPLDGGGRMPSVSDDAALRIDARFAHMPAPALFAALPAVHASTGELAGWLGLRGSMKQPQVRGRVDIHDVTMTLGELGQRFERANGTLAIEGNRLTLSHLRFSDLGGRADLSADMTLHTFDPFAFDARLEAKAKQLPIRRSGVLAAHLDGTLGARIHVAPERIEVLGSLRKARIELADAATTEPQSLADNPDIVFSGEPVAKIEAQQAATPVHIRIDASQPFWVRRSDFSALVSTDLTIDSGGETPSVVGVVTVQRGVVELLGQMFDIQRGTIEFSGGHAIEPILDLTATRKIPGAGGAVVQVTAHGSVHAPELAFEVDGTPATAGEALAAALGTRASPGGDADVQNELSSLATGIAGSVLTLAARRELGPWVPVLALERGAGETRVRAGVEADRFIPSFLRKVVVDAYVEGIVTNQEQTDNGKVTNQSSTGAAVLLDLRFPHDLNSEAQYGPGTRWSLDFGWEP